MDLWFTDDEELLDFLNDSPAYDDPETLLTRLEEQIDSGEIDLEEAAQILFDMQLLNQSKKVTLK